MKPSSQSQENRRTQMTLAHSFVQRPSRHRRTLPGASQARTARRFSTMLSLSLRGPGEAVKVSATSGLKAEQCDDWRLNSCCRRSGACPRPIEPSLATTAMPESTAASVEVECCGPVGVPEPSKAKLQPRPWARGGLIRPPPVPATRPPVGPPCCATHTRPAHRMAKRATTAAITPAPRTTAGCAEPVYSSGAERTAT